jgi:hypothetical protein
MTTYRKALALALIVAATTAPKAEAQRFHGGGFGGFRGGGFGGHSGFRGASFGHVGGASRVAPGYVGGFRTGYGFRSAYGYAGYRPFSQGLYHRDRDFRRGYGYPWYGYPYAYGYPYWGYGFLYGAYPYLGYGDYGQAFASEPSYLADWPGTGPVAGTTDQGASAAADDLLAGAGTPAFMGRLQWPLGLEILPGADSLRERINGLYATAAAQAISGNLNPQLPLQVKKAVKELKRLVASDKQERLTLSSAMYEQAEDFLNQLMRSTRRFSALQPSRPTQPYSMLGVPAKK